MQTRSQSNQIITTKVVMPNNLRKPRNENGSSSSPVTRSQTKKPVFDFDESSAAWLKNKTKLGNGNYSYKTPISGITTRSGKVLTA